MTVSEFCSTASSAAAEALTGTAAASTDTWCLVEVRSSWAPKPIESDALAGAPRAALEAWLARAPGSRLQLIRQPQLEAGRPLALFLGRSRVDERWLVRAELASYQQLADIDFDSVFAGRGGGDFRAADDVHLVCTHGKRDRCCAKWGVTVYGEASALAPADVWQTSHLGGHRFAPTTLSLPSGFCYGRLASGDAQAWLDSERRSELFELAKVRGRTAYPRHIQAAEMFALEDCGARGHDSLKLLRDVSLGSDTWSVSFAGPNGNIDVELRLSHGTALARASCADLEPRAVSGFVRVSPK